MTIETLHVVTIAGSIGIATGIFAFLIGRFLKTRTKPAPDPYGQPIGEGH